MAAQRFGNELRCDDRRRQHQRRQGGAQIVRRQALFADMRRQAAVVVRRMRDGMRPRRQLGEEENGDEQEMT